MGDRHLLRHHLAADQRRDLIVDQAEFDAERWYRILQDQKITVWYTAPTAIRMLMKAGAKVAQRFDLSNLRLLASVGEPLNPEAVVWGAEAFRQAVPRQLVADRDRRHHDLQLSVDGREARIDGPAAAGYHRRHRRAHAGRRDGAGDRPNPWPSASLRCGPAGHR